MPQRLSSLLEDLVIAKGRALPVRGGLELGTLLVTVHEHDFAIGPKYGRRAPLLMPDLRFRRRSLRGRDQEGKESRTPSPCQGLRLQVDPS